MYVIPRYAPFPADAQSSPFFGALATALLPALGITEDTPCLCGRKGQDCDGCGACGPKTPLARHHSRVYSEMQTFSGVGLGFAWPEDGSPYSSIPGWGKEWSFPDDFLGFLFGYAGLAWKRFTRQTAPLGLFGDLRESLDAGVPALLKLGDGPDWHAAVGYDGQDTLLALDTQAHPNPEVHPRLKPLRYTENGLAVLSDWRRHLSQAIVITGPAPRTVGIHDILTQMILTMHTGGRAGPEKDLTARLDTLEAGNAQEAAGWLLGLSGFPIEARWHAAKAMPSLMAMTEDMGIRDRLCRAGLLFHLDRRPETTLGACYGIWACLGVGAETKYRLPPDAGERLLRDGTRRELRRLFGLVFENDRTALQLFREAAHLTVDFGRHPPPTVPTGGGYGAYLANFMRKL